ncbi:ribonuclease R [Acetanaerobacterium elongatum]|uniref:Ribonuclease R n=1 Tax=Acetanaerobacterium elongatum TaxID=258515 RepID=A0A1H0BSB9_9FIRM|nr:ribonuclease R [Acetanaerobacterium elongatum]
MLAKKLGVTSATQKQYDQALIALVNKGVVVEKKGRLILSRRLGLIPATIVKLAGRFGFARELDGTTEFFVPGRAFKGAMVGDSVLLKRLPPRGESPEAEVVKVIAQGNRTLTGTLLVTDEGKFVKLDDMPNIPIRLVKGGVLGAADGDKVGVELVVRGESHQAHKAKVIEVFGSSDTAQACALSVLSANGIATEFPGDVLDQARAAGRKEITEKDLSYRLDLRGEPIFTIDGADTKDIDDAVSVIKYADGYKLGVHIADVSHYVKEGTPLDNEAFARGTSVYYANSVIPMLPKELSNGICSLNPQEDRLAFSCLMELDASGVMQRYEFKKTVIRSRVKGVYSELNRIYDDTVDETIKQKYAEVLQELPAMKELAELRMKLRKQRGTPDLDSPESKIIIGEDGTAIDIKPRERGFTEGLIEEFMLCANEAAATLAKTNYIPFVYRIHEKPTPEKLEALAETLRLLGLNASAITSSVSPKDMADILEKAKSSPLYRIVNNQVLRAMAKARYSDNPVGHFGLVLENYSHFTSPIRRYPDLAIHRILSAYIAGVEKEKLDKRFSGFAKAVGVSSSESELRAMTAERDCEDCYKAEYMRKHIGEVYEGVISSAAQHGVYVELENTVEGLIHVDRFPPGNYEFDGRMQFTDTVSGRRFRIGDRVKVVVSGADVAAGNIDFDFAETAQPIE